LAVVLSLLLAGSCAPQEKQEPKPERNKGEQAHQTQSLVCKPPWRDESSWRNAPHADELKNPLAIAAIAGNDTWIVGTTGSSGARRTQAAHWDGSSWSLVPTPNVGEGDNALNGVDGSTGEDVWAVGYSEHATLYNSLIEHWNGARWRVVESPDVGTNRYNTLTSVDALSSTDAWAVGSYRTATSRKTLIQRWDGTSWKIVSSPNPGTLSNSLLGVAAVGPSDIWAVGWRSSGGEGLRSLVLHRDGTRWTQVAVPAVGTGDNVLTSISAVGAKDVWATGYYVDGTKYRTLTLHYNGTTWRRVPSPNGGDGISILRDVGAFSSTNAWAVGFEYRAAQNRYVASTQHWDGSTWTGLPSGISRRGRTDSQMYSVAQAPDTSRVWASGQPADVESACWKGNKDKAAMAPNQETAGSTAPTISSKLVSERSSSSSEEPSASSNASGPSVSAQTSVKAVDKAADTGISEITKTHGATIADFNNDGKPDIFLGRHTSLPRFYVNEGNGHFTETNKGTFAQTDRHGCDAADVNGDGLKDIFCSVGAEHGSGAKRNELYIQRPDHTFAERAGQYGVFDPFSRGRVATFIDANGDSRPDLFLGNEADRGDGMPSPDRFFVNQGGATYRPAPEEYGLEREGDITFNSGASVGDLDKDGWEDLVLATPSGLRVYHNDEGKGFTEVAASVGLGQIPEAVTLSDVNGDSWPDVIEVSPNELRVLLNSSGRFSSAFSTTLEYGSSVAAGDVNGDDRPDIYVMRGKDATGANAPDQVYLNDGNGTGFAKMASIPSTSEGKAESVWPIDYDQNGLTDFLVLNGGTGGGGPVQLIAFFPAP
jgi:hypothetical protein